MDTTEQLSAQWKGSTFPYYFWLYCFKDYSLGDLSLLPGIFGSNFILRIFQWQYIFTLDMALRRCNPVDSHLFFKEKLELFCQSLKKKKVSQ